MEFRIFDVSHGFCAYLIADNGNVMLFDCGHNENTGFRPSTYLRQTGCTAIEYLVLQNLDQDHISDLLNVKDIPIQTLWTNRTISCNELAKLKEKSGPISVAMKHVLDMFGTYNQPVTQRPDLAGIEFKYFFNNISQFEDTNNLSLVSFLHFDGLSIILPGDLETKGWKALIEDPDFRTNLSRVNVFVASHHGRESGYCPEVFDYCRPDIVIVSDCSIQFGTQDIDYSKYARGVPLNGGREVRYVLTTRSDGDILISKKPNENYLIATAR